jgi:hypothetical protein
VVSLEASYNLYFSFVKDEAFKKKVMPLRVGIMFFEE